MYSIAPIGRVSAASANALLRHRRTHRTWNVVGLFLMRLLRCYWASAMIGAGLWRRLGWQRKSEQVHPIQTNALANMPDRQPVVVFCAGTPWTGMAGSDRHLATALVRYARILWVDPPTSFLTRANRYQVARGIPWPVLSSVLPGLEHLRTAALPGFTRPGLRLTTPVLVRAQIRWALRQLNVRPAVIVACSLDDVLTGWGPNVLKVQYGTDDYVAGAELMGLNRHMLQVREQRQLANANVVVAVSPTLVDRWSKMAEKVVLIPNGAQVAFYAHTDTVPPARDVSLPSPVAGVIGHLSSRIDVSLLEAVADAGFSLLLVGSRDPNWETDRFAALVRKERVTWIDRRTPEELPGYLRWIDVGLTPYADTPFNRASFPLKTLEYLAAGRPVVSTDLPAARWLNTDLVSIAKHRSDFVAAVRDAIATSSPEDAQRRKAFAAQHSWEQRAEAFARAIGLDTTRTHGVEAT